jgi:hypothetical protein
MLYYTTFIVHHSWRALPPERLLALLKLPLQPRCCWACCVLRCCPRSELLQDGVAVRQEGVGVHLHSSGSKVMLLLLAMVVS